jgi:hypothetical protein
MQLVTFSSRSLLVGDEAAEVLLEYAAVIAQFGGGDTVQLAAVDDRGAAVVATFLLDLGTPLMAETVVSDLPEPDNREAVAYMRHELAQSHGALLGEAPSADDPE